MLQKLKGLLAYEPAALAWAVNGGIAIILSYLVHLTPTQLAAVTTITMALSTIYTAARARPVSVSILVGGLATIAVASAAFGLHLTADQIGTGVTVLSAVLGLLFRNSLTPAKARPLAGVTSHLAA